MAIALTAELEAELQGTPELRELQRANAPYDPADYPKPTQADIESGLKRLRPDFAGFHKRIREGRESRYLRDRMPDKWARQLELGEDEHIHSRLGHNTILQIVAMATRNPPKFRVEPADGKNDAQDRAQKQTRWLNNLWPSFERGRAIRRSIIDAQVGDGLGLLEIYRTGSYDRLDTDRQDGESNAAYLRRTEREYIGAKAPYGVRAIDPLAMYWDEDGDPDDPRCELYIEEDVARAPVWRALKRSLGNDGFAEFQAARTRGKEGGPPYGDQRERPGDTVRKITYYDRRWMATIIDGVLIGDVEEHGMGSVPVVFYEGMTTGSPNRSERYQGAFWGMEGLEKAYNWLTTLELDNAFALSKPKLAITTPLTQSEAARHIGPGAPTAPEPVDFSGGKVPRLRPGEVPVNLTETFRGYDTAPLKAQLMQLIQISGLNPIAQGESPGSDPAGYAINALQSAAQAKYEVILDNACRGDAAFGNKIRYLTKHDLKMPWYLTAPMRRRRGGEPVWAGLGPDDIDDTGCEVTIDPLSDVNRMAVQQSLRQANKEGYLPRWRVQEAYGVDDYEMEDDDIIEDTLEAQLASLAIEEAKAIVVEAMALQRAPTMSPLVDQYGNPMPSSQGAEMANGAQPAPTNAPNVGGGASGASSAPFETQPGAASQSSSSARAGFDRGQRPPGTGAM